MTYNKNEAGNSLPKIGVYSHVGYSLSVYGTKENPFFRAKSIIDYLGLGNITEALRSLDDDEKLSSVILKSGQRREMKFVNESGLYHLIFQSRKPEAKKFRKWVTAEVLPSLRKTGRYEVGRKLRLLPREKGVEMAGFFDELTKWTTLSDEKMVAELMHVTAKHVHEVVRGRTQSYGVCCMLVEQAAENRKQGIRRVSAYNRDRRNDMEQLRLEFMEG
ncbi:MAG: BRO-N domain-containing protein [Phocaeicola sp.]|uniref:BRO-N domain-containing protein n=1 Tax=Phocaeicola sp. TaxID=2773926 RepID=UPI003FA15797